MTTYTLNKYQGGTLDFSVGQLEAVLTHLAASFQNEAQGSGIVYMRGEPGLLVGDTASPVVRTLMYSYTAQPSLDFTPPIAFMSGGTAVSLTDALLSSGVLIPVGQSLEETLSLSNLFFYNGQNPFEGPQGVPGSPGLQGIQGPPPSDQQVAGHVSTFLTSEQGTSTLTPLVSSTATSWLTANESALVSTVPGPQGSQGIQGESVIGPMGQPGIGEPGPPGASVVSASVSGTDIVFVLSDGSSVSVSMDAHIQSIVDSYFQANPPSGGASVQSVSVDGAGLLSLTLTDSTVITGDLSSFLTNALAALPAPISSASLSGTMLVLSTSSGAVSVDLAGLGGGGGGSVSESTLTQMYQRPWYYFSPKAGTRQNFMYTSSLNSYSASAQWRVETWIRLRAAVLNGYGTVLDTRSYPSAGGSDWLIFFIWGGSNGNFPAVWTPSGGVGFQYNTAPFVKANDWSHVVWQCSPSTGLQILVDGVLAQTIAQNPTFGVSSNFCFGNVVDQVSNVGNWALRLDADVSQLLVRVGASVQMYADGYTPPQSLSLIAENASDTVYCMPRDFKNMILPASQIVDEYY